MGMMSLIVKYHQQSQILISQRSGEEWFVLCALTQHTRLDAIARSLTVYGSVRAVVRRPRPPDGSDHLGHPGLDDSHVCHH